jgi:hypothetical protein
MELALAWCRSKNFLRACAQQPNSMQGGAACRAAINKAL